jgi:hypothetical protein
MFVYLFICLYLYLFIYIYGLFEDAVNNSAYTALDFNIL